MSAKIHPTSIISPKAEIGEDVIIGPYCIIGENVKIGKGTILKNNVYIEKNTEIGEYNEFNMSGAIGIDPQDKKYNKEETYLIIGNRNVFREFVTISRGTIQDKGKTIIGNNNLFMAYVHIAHDCIVKDNTIIGNATNIAGHCIIGNNAIIGGLTGVHQFTKIGDFAIIGGVSRVNKDIIPYCEAAGNPLRIIGINKVGLARNNFSEEDKNCIKKAYKILFSSEYNVSQSVKKIKEEEELIKNKHIKILVEFIENSLRGISKINKI
ncbi:MAG TPA: acyl-ACP--UDP-N-acetylglucosamine O-acyltransferase [bacterium]|nr:acyl-ACP--UDP-N-acetylglucosamine O-acyltransferase [bacterium]HOL48506.1 acyl-ACP--UDP-N-acetylglucosamine O-acyltransferase [bacterium]HPQ20003.1 acyl-ACP--UDP-N-acetylglucosamine O-acyltransferase [bacterium]